MSQVTLTTRKTTFGSTCEVDEKFCKQIASKCGLSLRFPLIWYLVTLMIQLLSDIFCIGIVENILAWSKFKQAKDLKKSDGKKQTRIAVQQMCSFFCLCRFEPLVNESFTTQGIPKLEDANFAGTAKGSQCTLILTEGDSAKGADCRLSFRFVPLPLTPQNSANPEKNTSLNFESALAVSGLGVIGRDKYGVFPLKGKLLNVREASASQLNNNAEVKNGKFRKI